MPAYWLKAVGHAKGPLDERWIEERAELLRRTGFPRRPRIVPGDRLVLYAGVAACVRDRGGDRPARAA